MADQETEYNITIVSADNIDTREMTTAEINDHKAQTKIISDNKIAEANEATAKENLKASAKQKLINGEPLTEEEADTIVL